MANEKGTYWDTFYAEKVGKLAIDLPSQFAVFFAGEAYGVQRVVDFGCGSGRDSLFFAHLGADVLGVDGSAAAVELCTAKADKLSLSNVRFLQADLGNAESVHTLIAEGAQGAALYARFFLHAIDEAAEAAFLSIAHKLIGDSILAVEFRTARDARQEKVTETHYRRYIDPLAFMTRAASHGLRSEYFAEGFGYAKYRNDDAHVARVILRAV